MTYKILWDEQAIKQLKKMHRAVAKRITKKVRMLQKDPFVLDVKKLQGEEEYRLRVGDYRVLFTIYENTIEIHHVKHRRNVYK